MQLLQQQESFNQSSFKLQTILSSIQLLFKQQSFHLSTFFLSKNSFTDPASFQQELLH